MSDPTQHALVTAVSLAHGTALARLLRAHGRRAQAEGLEAALEEVFKIVSAELGGAALAEAIRWVAEQTGEESTAPATPPVRH